MRRRKFSLKCCVFAIGIPLLLWFLFNILNFNFKVSSSWFTPNPNANKLHIKARKLQGGKKVEKVDLAVNKLPNILHVIRENECDTIKDIPNLKVKESYSSEILHNLGIIKNPTDQKLRERGYQKYAFNDLISSRIGFHRDIPDSRNSLCKEKRYGDIRLKASIIICFYNEAISALLRTVHSVLDRTPSKYINEILLVDDSSDDRNLSCQVKNYVKSNFQNVRYVRTPEREGLIRARVFGASHATGEVIIFLDSHCEVNIQWIEPLLSRISEHRTTVVVPLIDIIDSDTMEYTFSPIVRGGFNWGLHFKWDSLPSKAKLDPKLGAEPIVSPTMAGGLFAMDRKYFHFLGDYDTGMDIWGGENLEISFRIWQCGGRLEILPCSRVGHIFRKRRPYGSPSGEDTMLKNSLRVAHVWMDEYKDYFLKQRSESSKVDFGDISDRISLRKRLRCKSFDWYLKNIYPELPLPDGKGNLNAKHRFGKGRGRNYTNVRRGQLKHAASNLCVQSEEQIYSKKSLLILKNCGTGGKEYKTQIWFETSNKELSLVDLLCMDIETTPQGKAYTRLMKCHGAKGSQEWIWTAQHEVGMLYNPASGKCLTVTSPTKNAYLTVDICGDNPNQGFKMW